jgi:hypothetical protein
MELIILTKSTQGENTLHNRVNVRPGADNTAPVRIEHNKERVFRLATVGIENDLIRQVRANNQRINRQLYRALKKSGKKIAPVYCLK